MALLKRHRGVWLTSQAGQIRPVAAAKYSDITGPAPKHSFHRKLWGAQFATAIFGLNGYDAWSEAGRHAFALAL